MGFHSARPAVTRGQASDIASALDLTEGLDALTSTAITDLVAGDGAGGWRTTSLLSLAAGSLATVNFQPVSTAFTAQTRAYNYCGAGSATTVTLPTGTNGGEMLVIGAHGAGVTIAAPGGQVINAGGGIGVIPKGCAVLFAFDGISSWNGIVVPQVSAGEITAGTETDVRALSPADVKALVLAHETGEANPTQVSGGEITAGTETALRSYSPADVVSFISQHGSGSGPTEFFLANIFNSGFTSAGGSTPTNNWGQKINWDVAWRSLFSTFEIKVSGYKIGSAVAKLYVKQGSTTYWSPTFSLTSIATGTTSVATLASSSMPSGSGVLDVIFDSTGNTTIGNISLWGIL